jgi:hypothetical protein
MTYDRSKQLELCLSSFLTSTQMLKDNLELNPSPTNPIGVALVVNGAFAVELALKRILEGASGSAVRGHELRKLWNKLDPSVQSKITPLVCSQIPLPMSRFDEYLDKCSNTFVDWRYMYEKPDNFTNYLFLFHLANELSKL